MLRSWSLLFQAGIDLLVDFVSSRGTGPLVESVLTALANDPLVQRFCITPALVEEMLKPTAIADRKLNAVYALSRLYDRAELALPSLLQELRAGSINRKPVAQAIRCCGDIGEQILIRLLEGADSSR